MAQVKIVYECNRAEASNDKSEMQGFFASLRMTSV